MPRPSWPRRYTTTPCPAAATRFQGDVELHAAVAAQRPEHVAGEALGVDADEDVGRAGDLAAHEGEVLGAVEDALVDVRGELAVTGRDAGLGDAADQLLALAAVPDEIGDGDDLRGRARRRRRCRRGRRAIVPSSFTTSASTPAG